ncbi:MAG: hypothetical protein JWN30_402 [Bacilli bacterium]|nr:hypothetical protein [Bacilli bacterium]
MLQRNGLSCIGLALCLCFLLNPAVSAQGPVDSTTTPLAIPGADLRKQLEELRDKTRIPPIDAKIDDIWKAIPELNGSEIDVDKSYQAAVKAAGNPYQLVYKELPAARTLSSLPPTPIYRGNPGKNQIALMINVAWGEEYLPSMVRTLQAAGAGATFFLDGSWTTKHPDIARKLAQDGFEIGNHAYHHPDMKKLSAQKQREEIASTNEAIRKAVGFKPSLFAPPSGSYSQTTVDIAAGVGMKTILWTADTIDWQRPAPTTIIRRIMTKAGAGTLVLMHPTEPTAKALPELTKQLQQKGYQLVTVSTLLDPRRAVNS